MSALAHVAGVPVEEGLLALGPAALACGGLALARLRGLLGGRTTARRGGRS